MCSCNEPTNTRLGNVFERRLIEAYIQENGRDPVTGEELSVEDLIDLKTSRVVKPRPPTLTSIPSLLSVFQNEWDALALESYTLKQSLSQLRQELSTALYNNDAAVRVIARLTKERDEARNALASLSVGEQISGASNGNGEAMQVDSSALPQEIAAKVDALQEKYANLTVLRLDSCHLQVFTDSPRRDASVLHQKVGLRLTQSHLLISLLRMLL